MDGEYLSGVLWESRPGEQPLRKGNQRCFVGVRHVQLLHLAVASLSVGGLRASMLVGSSAAMRNSTHAGRHAGDTVHWQISGMDYLIHGALMASYWLGHALSPLPLQRLLVWAQPTAGRGRGLQALAAPCGLRPTPLLTVALVAGAASALAMPSLLVRGEWAWAYILAAVGGAGAAAAAPGGPLLGALLNQWVPPGDSSIGVHIVCFSVQAGLALGVWACGSSTSLWLGWRAPWLLGGGAALVAAVCIALLTDDSPDKHPAVGDAEKQWIKDAISDMNIEPVHSLSNDAVHPRVCSSALWGTLLSRASLSTVFTLLVTHGGDFLKQSGATTEMGSSLLTRGLLCGLALAALVRCITQKWQPAPAKRVAFWKLLNAVGTVVVISILLALAGGPSGARAQYLLMAALVAHGLLVPCTMELIREVLTDSAKLSLHVVGVAAAAAAAGSTLAAGELLRSQLESQSRWRWLFLTLAVVLVFGQTAHWLLTPNMPRTSTNAANSKKPAAKDQETTPNTHLLENDDD